MQNLEPSSPHIKKSLTSLQNHPNKIYISPTRNGSSSRESYSISPKNISRKIKANILKSIRISSWVTSKNSSKPIRYPSLIRTLTMKISPWHQMSPNVPLPPLRKNSNEKTIERARELPTRSEQNSQFVFAGQYSGQGDLNPDCFESLEEQIQQEYKLS